MRNARRKAALLRLEQQLRWGTKDERVPADTKKGYKTTMGLIPLEEADIIRIKKEIRTLKERVTR